MRLSNLRTTSHICFAGVARRSFATNQDAWVASQLVLHRTHTGSLVDGTPPIGRTVAYPGASFTQVEGDNICWEQRIP
jgi:hypothetical protein